MKQHRTAEEVAALAVLKAAKKGREKAEAQVKRERRAFNELLKALQLTLSELPELPRDRVLGVFTAIVSDEAALASCEKALAKPPRGWDKVETELEAAE